MGAKVRAGCRIRARHRGKIPEMHNLWWIPIVPLSSLLLICGFVCVHATTSWQPVVTGSDNTLSSDPTIDSSGKYHTLQTHVRGLRRATCLARSAGTRFPYFALAHPRAEPPTHVSEYIVRSEYPLVDSICEDRAPDSLDSHCSPTFGGLSTGIFRRAPYVLNVTKRPSPCRLGK